MKRAFVTTFLSLSVAFGANGDQRIYLPDDPILHALTSVYREQGIAPPSTSGPFAASEIKMMLERIDEATLSDAGRANIDSILATLADSGVYREPGGLAIDVEPQVTVEAYVHTNDENSRWIYGFDDRNAVLEIPLSFTIGDSI